MNWLLFLIACNISFIAGAVSGISYTMYLIRKGIREADIASDDKRFVNDVLGIRP